jgi:heme A synthase
MTRFARFAWGLLAYDVGVAAWGAYVRATGSGAGCGRHWPLCNGEVVPQAPRVETLIELSHRLSSGAALVLTAALLAWSWRAYPAGHRVRSGALAAMAFMIAEAAIGAALVLFQLVAHDASAKRALSVSLHLVNTFLLLASTALTAWWATGFGPIRIRGQGLVAWTTLLPLGAMLLVGSTGAVTALGDTLFPSASVAMGLAEDLAPRAHLFVRLRALHPLLATMTAASIVVAAGLTRACRPTQVVRTLSRAGAALAMAQVAAGLLDIVLLAPLWLQLGHLLLADAVWLALVLTAAAALSGKHVLFSASDSAPPAWPLLQSLRGSAPADALERLAPGGSAAAPPEVPPPGREEPLVRATRAALPPEVPPPVTPIGRGG